MNLTRIDSRGILMDYDWDGKKLANDLKLLERIGDFIPPLQEGYIGQIRAYLGWLRATIGAEAGAVYAFDRYALRYIYVQNDALNHDGGILDERGENAYSENSEFMNKKSTFGYAAITKRPLLIDDVRAVPNKMPFYQSRQSDCHTCYRPISLLNFPVVNREEAPDAVVQLTNKQGANGLPVPFTDEDLGIVAVFMEKHGEAFSRALSACREATKPAERESAPISAETAAPKLRNAVPWLVGSGLSWTEGERSKESSITRRITAFVDFIHDFHDMHTMMDLILTEARTATGADAGTFYVVEGGDWLRFSYVQNDTLFDDEDAMRQIYVDSRIPITGKSISGYAAEQRTILNVRDVYNLPLGAMYGFNRAFDEASGYRTTSVLAIPIVEPGGNVIAVLQLINSKDPDGSVRAFDKSAELYAHLLAVHAMPHLLRSITAERTIRRMTAMLSLNDDQEGADHVLRVASFASEIYHKWAVRCGTDTDTIRTRRDLLRPAAMLHDVGMISVSSTVLKKPGPLSPLERAKMQAHCVLGASIFANAESDVERLAHEITLNHHQRWDGTGYTGSPDAPVLSGCDIPAMARIVAVADALDAMVTPRVYKKAWNFAGALDQLKKGAGTQFDREMVDAALEIEDTLRAIFQRYQPQKEKERVRMQAEAERFVSTPNGKIIWIV